MRSGCRSASEGMLLRLRLRVKKIRNTERREGRNSRACCKLARSFSNCIYESFKMFNVSICLKFLPVQIER